MEILATSAMNFEGQVGAAAIPQTASGLQANADFAAELERKLQVKTNPALTSGARAPERAPGKGTSSKDGIQSQQAVGSSAVSAAATVTAGCDTAPSSSTADDRPTLNPGQAATAISESSTVLSPEIALPFAKNSAQPADDGGEETASSRAGTTDEKCVSAPAALQNAVAKKPNLSADILSGEATQASTSSLKPQAPRDKGSKTPSVNKAASAGDSSTLSASCLAQAFATGQDGSAHVAGSTSERVDTLNATSPSPLGKGLQSAGVETLAPSPNMTTQLGPQNPSSSLNPKAEAAQDKGSKASSANIAAPAEANSTSQPSRPAQTLVTGQLGSAHAAGSTSDRLNALNATSPSQLGKGSQSAALETLAPLPNVTTQLGLQNPPSGTNPKAEASQDKGSKVSSANKATPAEASSTLQPSRLAQTFATGQHGSAYAARSTSDRSNALNPTSPSCLDKASQSAALETLAPLQNGTTQVGQQDSSRRLDALDITSLSRLGKATQSAALETLAPLQNETTEVGLQDPSSGPNPKAEAPQGGGSNGSSANQVTPAEARSTVQPSQGAEYSSSPQLSPLVPGVITAQEGTTPVEGSATAWEQIEARSLSSPGKGLQAAGAETHAPSPQGATKLELQDPSSAPEAGARPQAESGPDSASRAQDALSADGQDPAPTNDIDTASSAHGSKQANASTDKKGGEAASDSTKVTDGKGGLPRANVDPTLAPQLTPEGGAEAGRASPPAAGASQGRGEAESASVLHGYEANDQTAVRSARFTQQAGNAEMQVRLRTEALGRIDVHTVVKGSEIGASIRVEARETQVMLANELSQLERALNERSLRVEHLDVLQGSVSGGQSNGAGRGHSEGSPSEPRPSFSSYSTSQPYASLPEGPTVSEDVGLGLSTTRINLRV